ncbi:MAG: TonB-dependent receptor [Bryobacteraceae bacterium]
MGPLRPIIWLLVAIPVLAQVDTGELRLTVTDSTGLALPSAGTLVSQATQTRREFRTDGAGHFTFQHLPFGVYRLTVEHANFATTSALIEIRSSLPREYRAQLSVETQSTEVVVTDAATLVDPHRTGVTYSVGAQQIREQQSSIPGRGLIDLINLQPGWLPEANAVMHPRGSENQTLFVVDGVPMDENRSPAYSPDLDTGEVQSMSILTGNYPAEYGRKLGGVIEVTTSSDLQAGFHGSLEAGGGSFDDASGFASAVYGWTHSAITVTGSGEHTNRYLDPPVLRNFTNNGTLDGASLVYDRDLTERDRLHLSIRRNQTAFEIPNENIQETAGQRQNRNSRQDLGQIAWTHGFSPELLFSVRASVEDLSANLWSNTLATPVVAFQERGFRRAYGNATLAAHKGRHEIKLGVDGYYAPVSEALRYRITDFSFYDPGTPANFGFNDHRMDREEAAFAQDTMRFGNLTLSAGLRWDSYRLVVRDNAWSPRMGAAWYWPKGGMIFRFSYDRAFITPALENLLLASSPQVDSVGPEVLRIPVRPSRGNFLETGFGKEIFNKARLDASFYRRTFVNYADDDVFLNTGISFPISFARSEIHGVDVKLVLPRWGKLSGFAGYSNMTGTAWLPVSGGLFLGDAASGAIGAAGSFPITQDQRNTVRARLRYQMHPRVWIASVAGYGSGLPVELDGEPDLPALTEQYGARIIERVNFSAGRVRPAFSWDASLGADLWKREKRDLRLEIAGENLTNRLNVINFAGLFSGTAIAAPRSGTVRLRYEF